MQIQLDQAIDFRAGDAAVRAVGVKPFFSVEAEPIMLTDDATGLKSQLIVDGVPQFRSVEKIKIVIIGDRTCEPLHSLTDHDRKRFAYEYKLWKDGEDYEFSGTPLTELTGITKSQIDILMHWHVTSVEHLAELEESRARDLGNRIPHARELAIAWVRRANDGAADSEMAAELLKMRELIAQLQSRTDSAERENQGLKAAMDALGVGPSADDEEPEPRPRKRRKARGAAASVEALNPNAVPAGTVVAEVEDNGENPLAEGVGDPVDDLIG